MNRNILNILAKVFFWHTILALAGLCGGIPLGFILAKITYTWISLKLFFILQFIGCCCGILFLLLIVFIPYLKYGIKFKNFSQYHVIGITNNIVHKTRFLWIIWAFFSALTLQFYTKHQSVYWLALNLPITLYASLTPYLFFTHCELNDDYDGDVWITVTDITLDLVSTHFFSFLVSFTLIQFININFINKIYSDYIYIF
jgi:hypothetical protein